MAAVSVRGDTGLGSFGSEDMYLNSKELIYSLDEFKTLAYSSICRYLGLGDDWLDEERDAWASREQTKDEES